MTSDQPILARAAKPTTLIQLSKIDGGGGYTKLVTISIDVFVSLWKKEEAIVYAILDIFLSYPNLLY